MALPFALGIRTIARTSGKCPRNVPDLVCGQQIRFVRGDELVMQQRGRRVTAVAAGEPAQETRNRGQICVADQVRADLKLFALQLPVELERFQKLEGVITLPQLVR
jgi:hypothetical protein